MRRARVWKGVMGAVLVGLGVLVGSDLEAATYYVGESGGGSCSTNQEAPSGSVDASLGCLKPGDTLYFLAGTYPVSITDPPSGTSSNRVTIAGAPGQRVVLRNAGDGRIFDLSSGVSYVTLDNFVMEGAGINFIVRNDRGGHHIRVQNSELFGSQKSAILTNNTGSEFINLHIHNIGSTDLDHGIYQSGDHTLMKDNHIHHVAGFGIHNYNGSADVVSNNAVVGNVVHDNDAPGILLSGGDNNLASNNVVYNNHSSGFKIWLGGSGNQVYNNTIYGNSTDCIYNEQDTLTVRNNICFRNGQDGVNNAGGGGLTQSNNLFGTDPLFVNAGAGDFHLKPGSPAIDAGMALPEVPTDIEGRARGGSVDIGAYEAGGGTPQPTAPAAPTDLRVLTIK